MLEPIEKCPLCHSHVAEKLFCASDRLGNEVFQIKKCSLCSLCFVDPRPSINEMHKYYPERYWGGKGQANDLTEKIRVLFKKRILLPDAKKLLKYKKNGKVLDIGCSQGFFLKLCNTLGYETYGVEVSSEARGYASQALGLKNIFPSINDRSLKERSFDFITMWSVLEHMHHPDEVLGLCSRLLSDEGFLIIQVPNIESSQAKKFKNRWAGIDAPRHLFHFSPQTLASLLNKNGFDLIEESHFYNRHNLYAAVASRFPFLDEHKLGISGGGLVFVLTKILKVVYAPVVFYENFCKKGATFYIVAKKINNFDEVNF